MPNTERAGLCLHRPGTTLLSKYDCKETHSFEADMKKVRIQSIDFMTVPCDTLDLITL